MFTIYNPYIIQFDCEKELNIVIHEFRDEFASILHDWEGNEGTTEHFRYTFKSNSQYESGIVAYPYQLILDSKSHTTTEDDADRIVNSALKFFSERNYKHHLVCIYSAHTQLKQERWAYDEQNYDELLLILEDTIQKYNENDIPSLQIRLRNEGVKGSAYGIAHDKSRELLQQEIAKNKQQDERFQQIFHLSQLASTTSRTFQDHALALNYLDECDALLESFTPEYIRHLITTKQPYETEEEIVRAIKSGNYLVQQMREPILSRME